MELRLPVAAESIRVGRQCAAQYAEEAGCDPATVWRVRLAISEAITNAVLHAYPDGGGDRHSFTLTARCGEGGVVFTITDDGTGEHSRSAATGMGEGLRLIARSCDAHVVGAVPGVGTAVSMTFTS